MGAAKGFLGTIATPAPIESLEDEKYRDKSIAYDLAVLRHRGKRCLDVETIARLQNDSQPGPVPLELWQPLVDYIVKWATKIASLVGKATFVLDGEALMSKSSEGERRRTDRMKSFSDAIAHQKKREEDGIDVDGKELHKLFAEAVDASIDAVTYAIIEAMSDGSWDFIQAPNEADAQLAKLAPSVDLVVCNDSDLIVYGCPVVMIIKTDGHGVFKGSMYVIEEAVRDERHIFFGLSRGQLIAVCLVVGCDFSAGIFKIGWKKAPKLVRESWDESDPCNIERLIAAAELVGGAVVPTDFQQQWNGGWATFNHQRAFDESTGTIQYLHQPAPEMEEAVAKLVGHPVRDVEISKAIASGFLHPSTRPWIEVVAASEDDGQLEADARIISRESESIARQLDRISERQRGALLCTFRHALKELEQSIDRRRNVNRLDPVVVDWERKEKEFQSNREAYCQINAEEGHPRVDEARVIQWTMLALQRLQEDHGDGFSMYALKAMPDERGVPRRNEDIAYVADTSRNLTVMRPVYVDEADDGAGTDSAREDADVIGGRHFRTSEIVRYGEHASLDTSGMLVHRFIQYPTFFRGDAGAYLGELLATRVCFVMMGGGTGRVLNRAYFGRVRDPAGLKRHSFGISAIPNFVAGLEAGTMGICNSQLRSVLRQFCQNLACDFTLLSLVGDSTTSLLIGTEECVAHKTLAKALLPVGNDPGKLVCEKMRDLYKRIRGKPRFKSDAAFLACMKNHQHPLRERHAAGEKLSPADRKELAALNRSNETHNKRRAKIRERESVEWKLHAEIGERAARQKRITEESRAAIAALGSRATSDRAVAIAVSTSRATSGAAAIAVSTSRATSGRAKELAAHIMQSDPVAEKEAKKQRLAEKKQRAAENKRRRTDLQRKLHPEKEAKKQRLAEKKQRAAEYKRRQADLQRKLKEMQQAEMQRLQKSNSSSGSC